jgi:hypothetical protein
VTDRWARITAIFGAARVLDPKDREAFLQFACGADPDARGEVDSLLAADHDDDGLLATPFVSPPWEAIDAPPVLLPEGRLLQDRYRVEHRLATGGQGHVYGAVDLALDRPVVLKVMRAGPPGNRALKSRFENERDALSRIDHPGVVGVLDVGETPDGSPFLVMQYINGVSLRELLQSGPLGLTRTAAIVRQLGTALAAAHACGIAHQDLKPENIMLQELNDGSEVVKLIDFGIAKVKRAGTAPDITTIMVAGTVRYMAPEQFNGDNSPAADIYALALVVCEMLSGQPHLRRLPRHVKGQTRRLLEAALASDPNERPPDIGRWSAQVATAIAPPRLQPARVLKLAALVAVAAVALTGLVLSVARPWTAAAAPPRVIEKVGAFDPLQEGFREHNRVTGTVAWNPERSGYEAWVVVGAGAGDYYYQELTIEQKKLALERGWSLSATTRLQQGTAFVVVDFAGVSKRFDIALYAEPDMDLVRLQTQIVPTFEGIETRLPRVPGIYRHYELRYDPGRQSADLWVDGVKRLENYPGLMQFQEDMGVFFGAGPYKSERGSASFKSVRFAIAP